jgi:outer membrane lipopolysaccharide assembly protein LptE/RlpB
MRTMIALLRTRRRRPPVPGPGGRGRVLALSGALVAVAALAGCGYHLSGHSNALPGIQTIGIPMFVNRTSRPEIEQRITEHIIDEFTTRGRARLVPGEEGAQAVLKGAILSYTQNPVTISEQGRATRYEILITAHVTLSEVATDKILWEDDHFLFKRQYDVAASALTFQDQEIVAVDEVATDFARSIVTSILEGF